MWSSLRVISIVSLNWEVALFIIELFWINLVIKFLYLFNFVYFCLAFHVSDQIDDAADDCVVGHDVQNDCDG